MTHDPETDLELTRDIKAPRHLLWDCWTRPELLMQWFVPKPHRVTACRIELRAGGVCNTTFDVDGAIIGNNGVYLEVVPQEKLVFTDTYTEGWRPAPEPFMTAIITFEDLGAGNTRYTARVRHRSAAAAKTHREMGFYEGWGTAADQMEAFAKAQMQERQIVLTRLIAATPQAIWAAWTDPAILPLWFGPEGFSCKTKEINLVVGGAWRFDMIGPDGKIWPNRHRFLVQDPPHRLEFLLDGDDDSTEPMQAEVVLVPESGGTRITQTLTLPNAAARAGALAFGADRLGQTTLAKLAALVEPDAG